MRVFVAGATGVIGRRVVEMLTQGGHIVTGSTRSQQRAEGLRSSGAQAVVCDALDADALCEAVLAARPEAVVHELTNLATRLDPRKYTTQLAATSRLRTEGTRNLIAAASAAGAIRLVAQSVAFGYAPTGDWIKSEDAPLAVGSPSPMDVVIGAVADLENQVRAVDGIVLRYGFLYGPGTQFASDGFYAELARKRRLPVIGSGDGRWSFVHVDDAAAATVAALERGSTGVYNIVDDEPAAARDWIPAYASSLSAPPPRTLPRWIGRLVAGPIAVAGMTVQRGATNAKVKRELGWSPEHPTWRDGFGTAGA